MKTNRELPLPKTQAKKEEKKKKLTLAINTTPPLTNPKAANNSVGGLEGITSRGGRRYIST